MANNFDRDFRLYMNATSVYQSIPMLPLDADMAEKLTQLYDGITEVKITNPVVRNMYAKSVLPYFNGIKSFEECSREFEQKISIYAEE